MTRAAIYLRVSTEEQTEGYGLDIQRERTTAQATAKGWTVVSEYVDAGISGTKDEKDRPGLNDLLLSAQAGDIDAVIILALDRLGRKTALVLDLVERLNNYGVAVVSCKESLDTTTPQGQFVLTMFAALAQLERDTIVERTTSGRDARGRVDGEKGGRIPLGYRRIFENGQAVGVEVADDTEAPSVVRKIFAMRKQGDSLRAIATYLNEHGYDTGKGGVQWYASSVKQVLDNKAIYAGGPRGASNKQWPALLV